jgi:hypothetical protein
VLTRAGGFARVLATGCFIALSACGGGGSGLPAVAVRTPLPATTPTAGPAGFAPVSFSIALPKAGSGSSARKPLFVPAPTTAITVSVNGTTPQTFPCTSSGCSGSFQAPAGGQVSFLFSALDAQSNLLANASVTQAIAANGTNVITVTLLGVIHSTQLSIAPAGLSSAASGQASVTATAYDADGDVITGTYASPLNLNVNDATGTVAVSPPALTSSTATGTITYTYGVATLYTDNHLLVGASSSTETTSQQPVPFEVGRTFYTFTPNSIVGFAPGSTTPTRTVPISPGFGDVTSITCDGTNVYVLDSSVAAFYGIVPGATAPASPYTTGGYWVAANGSPTTGNRAQVYIAGSISSSAVVGFQGAISSPPFPLPPNTVTLNSSNNSAEAVQVDTNGNVYAAIGLPLGTFGGYDVFGPALGSPTHSGMNAGTAYGPYQIAVDTSVSPPRIYTAEVSNIGFLGEVSEYDNFAATPTVVSTDNAVISNNIGSIFTDPFGRFYTSAPNGGFHVYNPGGLAGGIGNVQYTLPGIELAFDSEGYAYSLSAAGAITIYAPGSTNVVATLPGTNYGQPAQGAATFGTFCR